jgi:hypothetical protein
MHHSNFDSFIHMLDNVHVESDLEVQEEHARAEAPTDLSLDQDKARCILPIAPCLSFLITIYVLV